MTAMELPIISFTVMSLILFESLALEQMVQVQILILVETRGRG